MATGGVGADTNIQMSSSLAQATQHNLLRGWPADLFTHDG